MGILTKYSSENILQFDFDSRNKLIFQFDLIRHALQSVAFEVENFVLVEAGLWDLNWGFEAVPAVDMQGQIITEH